MEYEVTPRNVGGRGRFAVTPLVVGLVLVAIAAVSSVWEAGEAPGPASAPSVPPRPAVVECGELADRECDGAVAAAEALLAATEAPIVSVAADPSLLCGDDLDCPRPFLAGGRPVGSLVVTFADGVVAWVNVVAVDGDYSARVVRWFGAGP